MSTRADLAQLLTDQLGTDARVIGYAKSVDNIARDQSVVMVYREQVVPSPLESARVDTIAVWCAVPQTDPATADDALDALLDRVLSVIDSDDLPALIWSDAERGTFDDTWPAYKITATATATVPIT